MIAGQKRKDITLEWIRQRISDEEIYLKYIPGLKFNKHILSPFRKERTPSFVVHQTNGNYHHVDYGDATWRGDAIDLVKQLKNLNLQEALEDIYKEFENIMGSDTKPVFIEKRSRISTTLIQVSHKKELTKEAVDYWKQYHISSDWLRRHNVFQVSKLFINRKIVPIDDKREVVFAYFADDIQRVKIYKPYSIQGEWKWKSTIPYTYMFGKENITIKNAILAKSLKDQMVLELIYPHVCSIQAESIGCLNQENRDILSKPKTTYVGFGNDEQGHKESMLITSTFGWKHVNVPQEELAKGINDFAEYAKVYGLEMLKNLLSNKGII